MYNMTALFLEKWVSKVYLTKWPVTLEPEIDKTGVIFYTTTHGCISSTGSKDHPSCDTS
jgi:hypothetical protein